MNQNLIKAIPPDLVWLIWFVVMGGMFYFFGRVISKSEVGKTIAKVIVQTILDWKFAVFMGVLISALAIGNYYQGALEGYDSIEEVPDIIWRRIYVGMAVAGISALWGHLNSTVARARDALEKRKANGKAGGSDPLWRPEGKPPP